MSDFDFNLDLNLGDTESDNFELDLHEDDTNFDLDFSLSAPSELNRDNINIFKKTVDSSEIPDIDLSNFTDFIEQDDNSFDVDLNEDTPLGISINPALLGFKQVDVVTRLQSYLECIKSVEKIIFGNDKKLNVNNCVIDHKLFPDMPIKTLEHILIEIVANDITNDYINKETVAERVLTKLWEDLNYAPKSGRETVRQNIEKTYSDFVYMIQTSEINTHTLGENINKERFESTRKVLYFNIETFKALERIILILERLQDNMFNFDVATKLKPYLDEVKGNQTRPSTFNDWSIVISRFMQSEETCKYLNISAEESANFCYAELIRRLLVKDIVNGKFILDGLNYDSSLEDTLKSNVLSKITEAAENGSAAAEIISLLLLVLNLLVRNKTANRQVMLSTVHYLGLFLEAMRLNTGICNPVFYTEVDVLDGENDYTIQYPDITTLGTKSVKCSDVLCVAVGNASTNYVIPLGYSDNDGSFILPPVEVVEGMKNAVRVPSYKVNGDSLDIWYTFTPKLHWLDSMQIITSGKEESITSEDNYIDKLSVTARTVLNNYDSDFVDDNRPTIFSVFEFESEVKFKIFTVYNNTYDNIQNYSIIKVTTLVDNSFNYYDGKGQLLIYPDGTVYIECYYNNTNLDITLPYEQYQTFNNLSEYTENTNISVVNAYLYNSEVIDKDAIKLNLDLESRFETIENVTRKVCTACGFNYERLVDEAQKLICNNLYSVLKFNIIDKLLSKSLLVEYKKLIDGTIVIPESDNDLTINDFQNRDNIISILTLFSICGRHKEVATYLGEQANIKDTRKLNVSWDTDFISFFNQQIDKVLNTDYLTDYINYLDSLDFELLALTCNDFHNSNKVYNYNFEEDYMLLKTIFNIEPIYKRLKLLEQYVILARITYKQPKSVSMILSRLSICSSLIKNGLNPETFDKALKELRKIKKMILPKEAWKDMIPPLNNINTFENIKARPSSSLICKAILNNNILELIKLLDSTNNKALSLRLCKELNIKYEDALEMEPEDFLLKVPKNYIKDCVEKYRESLLQLIYEGIVAECQIAGTAQQELLLYSLIIDIGRAVCKSKADEKEKQVYYDEESFLSYSNSYCLSFAPISNEIDDTPRNIFAIKNKSSIIFPEYYKDADVELRDLVNTVLI